MSALNIYSEIGIEIYILNKKHDNDVKFIKNSEINYRSIKEHDNIEKKQKRIKELESSFKDFNGCNLKKTSTNFVTFFGNANSKILIIDGPPDIDEDKTGTSFVSKKGEIFEKMLNAINLKKNDTYIVKSIPWRPPGNRYPTMEEIKICRPFIFNLIKLLRPKIIVCLGEVATNQILELDQSISTLRGKWRLLKSGRIFKAKDFIADFSVLPTFNISQLLTRPDLKKYAWEDMKLLRDKIKETL